MVCMLELWVSVFLASGALGQEVAAQGVHNLSNTDWCAKCVSPGCVQEVRQLSGLPKQRPKGSGAVVVNGICLACDMCRPTRVGVCESAESCICVRLAASSGHNSFGCGRRLVAAHVQVLRLCSSWRYEASLIGANSQAVYSAFIGVLRARGLHRSGRESSTIYLGTV